MTKFNDNVGSSLQKLEQVLKQYAVLDGFDSSLGKKEDSDISNEIIKTILSEIEPFLVQLSDCEIDQVSGRIETKLAAAGAEGVSISDESLEKIKQKLIQIFSNTSYTISRRSSGEDAEDAEKDDNDQDIGENPEAAESEAKIRNNDFAEKIFDILNNINKDEKLKDFKGFLSSISPKHKQFSVFSRSITAGTLDEILPKVKFFKNFVGAVEKFAVKQANPILKMAGCIEKYQKIFEDTHKELVVNLSELAKKSMNLTKEIFKLAGTNIVLAGSYLVSAAAKIVLAASILSLAVANVVITVSNLVLLAAVVMFTLGVMLASAVFISAVAVSIGICIAIAFGAIMLTSLLVTLTMIAAALLIALVAAAAAVLTTGSAMLMSSAMIAGAAAFTTESVLLLLPLLLSVQLAGFITSAAILAGGLVLSSAAFIFSGIIFSAALTFQALTFILEASVMSAVFGVFSLISVISCSAAAFSAVFIVGIPVQLAMAILYIAAAVSLAVASQTALITAAIVALTAAAVMMTLVMALGIFVVLCLGFIYLRDRIIEELQKTTLYDWWTKDVDRAGGLWSWIKGWFIEQWPWLTDIWGYIKECVADAFHNSWLYIWWVDEIKAAGGVWSWIKYRLGCVWDWMTDLPTKIWNRISGWFNGICSGLDDFIKQATAGLTKWWQESSIKACLYSILNWLTKSKDKLAEGAKKVASAAGNAVTLGAVDKINEIGQTYDNATQSLADTTTNINRHTNEFVDRVSAEKLDAEIERVQKLWQNARKRGGDSGLVYAQALGKLRAKQRRLKLDDALRLLQSNSFDLPLLTASRDWLFNHKRIYLNGNFRDEFSSTLQKLDDRIAGIKNGSIRVSEDGSGLDGLDRARQNETIDVPGSNEVKSGEEKRSMQIDGQTDALNGILPSAQPDSHVDLMPVPVPARHNIIFTR